MNPHSPAFVRLAGALSCAVLLSLLGGCGLIFSGSQTTVPIESNPQGAEVWVDDVRVGTTPVEVELDSSEDHVLVFKRPGHADQTINLERSLSGGYVALNILFTGLIGLVVDAATGGWYIVNPDNVHAELPSGAATGEQGE